jgi:hypothetical protein
VSTVVADRKPSAADRWRALPRVWQIALGGAAGLVAISLLFGEIGSLYSSPNNTAIGPSSSLDTGPPGTAAFAKLLSQNHYSVQQLTSPTAGASLPSSGTLFILNPSTPIVSGLPTLKAFVASGGRLVIGGPPGGKVLRTLIPTGPLPTWQAAPAGFAQPVAHAAENQGVGGVDSGSTGSWVVPRAADLKILLEGDGGPLALLVTEPASAGRTPGSVVLLASDAALENSELAKADDAAFGLDLAGRPGAKVVFDEYVHGFGRAGGGLAGLPDHWKLALILAVLAAAVWMLSASRRLGPPQRAGLPVMPPRVAHVDALAELLSSGPPERTLGGGAPLRARARQLLGRRLNAPTGASDAELVRIAAQAQDPSLEPQLVTSLLAEPRTPTELVALARSLAELEGRMTTKGQHP